VCWHKLGEVENEYTAEKLVLSAIFVPKFFTIGRYLAKFWQKISLHSLFETRCSTSDLIVIKCWSRQALLTIIRQRRRLYPAAIVIGRVCWLVSSLTSWHWPEVGQVNLSRSRYHSGVFGLCVESFRAPAFFSVCNCLHCHDTGHGGGCAVRVLFIDCVSLCSTQFGCIFHRFCALQLL